MNNALIYTNKLSDDIASPFFNSNAGIVDNSLINYSSKLNLNVNEKESVIFNSLPSEYDIFSNIPYDKINSPECGNIKQKQLFYNFVNALQDSIHKLSFAHYQVLPKLHFSFDEDKSFVLNWNYNNYCMYVNFEVDPEKSYYGSIVKNNLNGCSSENGELNSKNFHLVASKFLQIALHK